MPQQGGEAAMQAEPKGYPEVLERGQFPCLFLGPSRLCGLILIGNYGEMAHIYGAIYN